MVRLARIKHRGVDSNFEHRGPVQPEERAFHIPEPSRAMTMKKYGDAGDLAVRLGFHSVFVPGRASAMASEAITL